MSSLLSADQVVITGTGYFGASRREIRQLAWKLGAQYRGDLTHSETTHLVCRDTGLPDSEKVSVAHTWGIAVVQHSWLSDSVDCQTVLPVQKYLLPLKIPAAVSLVPGMFSSTSARVGSYSSSPQRQQLPSIQSHWHSEAIQVEVLRAAEVTEPSPLAALLMSTTLSPNTGRT